MGFGLGFGLGSKAAACDPRPFSGRGRQTSNALTSYHLYFNSLPSTNRTYVLTYLRTYVLTSENRLDVCTAGATDSRRDDYDDMAVVESGAQHLFLPAPGSAGVREALFDGVFGL